MRDNLNLWVMASPVKADTGIRLSKAQTSSLRTLEGITQNGYFRLKVDITSALREAVFLGLSPNRCPEMLKRTLKKSIQLRCIANF